MAAPRKSHPREGAQMPTDGRFLNVVSALATVAGNERANLSRAEMEQAFDAAKAQLAEIYPAK